MAVGDPNPAERIEQIYRTQYVVFCRLATGITGNAESAREAVQEGFAQALARCDQFRGEGPMEAWLWRIVLRAAIDMQRRERSVPRPVADPAGVELAWSPVLPHPERDRELDMALRALPGRQRLVVFLRYFADLSHAEIAVISGMQPGTVSATLTKAKATLAARLAEHPVADKEVQR